VAGNHKNRAKLYLLTHCRFGKCTKVLEENNKKKNLKDVKLAQTNVKISQL
jgi:hypothetical protein